MNYDPVKLILEFGSILNGILTDRIDADEKIARELLPFTIIKGNYICEVIMLKIFLIYIQYIIV